MKKQVKRLAFFLWNLPLRASEITSPWNICFVNVECPAEREGKFYFTAGQAEDVSQRRKAMFRWNCAISSTAKYRLYWTTYNPVTFTWFYHCVNLRDNHKTNSYRVSGRSLLLLRTYQCSVVKVHRGIVTDKPGNNKQILNREMYERRSNSKIVIWLI